ncbi:MAG: ABC transporter ATP-binding protein [Candidatus Doudnabacteria bacterium]|nr:ABC transporter ATP-binding protein [Candidatus Doudnabacteria bacterium]
MSNIIEVRNLTKKYGDFTAVDHISFDVHAGEVFGILGPNGAGKTTTLEMIEGLKSITSGTAVIDNKDVSRQAHAVKHIIGVQLQASSFFEGLNLIELLNTFASLYDRKVNAMDLLRMVQLEEKAKSQVKELSGGQKQRMSIAVALVNDPKIIFLDEPTTGLDPQARRNLWDLVQQINRDGKTVVITTHYMDEAEVLCDRIAIMDHAKIVAMDNTENLLKLPGLNSSVNFKSHIAIPKERLETLQGVTSLENGKDNYKLITVDPERTLTSLFALSKVINFQLLDLQLRQPTLEDVFLKLTGHALRD